jgi:hypothetical protein
MSKPFTLVWGIGKRFAIGFSLERYAVNIDLGPFWIGVEW